MKKPALAAALVLALAACHRDPATVEKQAAQEMSAGDYKAAEEDFRWLAAQRPRDTRIQANLAFALTEQEKNAEAIPIYEKLVGGGDGAYDLFAFYAKSLDGVGRDDEAITWNYRALQIVPSLVDVRGDLAKILVRKGRAFEALTLLASFDHQMEDRGHDPYFQGQRIAISAKLPAAAAASNATMQATRIEGAYYTIAIGKNGENVPFLIDTGASHTTMSREVLQKLGIAIPDVARQVTMETADGRQVLGRQFTVPQMQIGPFVLRDIPVVQCSNCDSLLGQSTLEHFDLATRKTNGLEILTMKLR